MPIISTDVEIQSRHSDDMQDIITTVPSWLLRWGTTLFFAVLVLILGLSAVIRYPDIVKTQLKVESLNSPKSVVAKIPGKLTRILATEGATVIAGEPLAYMESTGNHQKILELLSTLKTIQQQVLSGRQLNSVMFNQADNSQFGELQSAYQLFFQEYLTYQSSIEKGFYLKKKVYLVNDLTDLQKQKEQLNAPKLIQQRDLKLGEDEYNLSKRLLEQKAETPANVRLEESKYLSKKSPLIQTEAAMIAANTNVSAKQKEILELDNLLLEEKGKFLQALNSLISSAEEWKSKYILSASQNGTLSYAGIMQENQVLSVNQEVFYVNPGNLQFFGEMGIPQNNMGKIKEGQEVLVKLKSYPFEEYGMIRGRISYIAEVPYRDSVFISKVDFKVKNSSDLKRPVHLKQGMLADAEIVTQDATILQRITRSLIGIIGNRR